MMWVLIAGFGDREDAERAFGELLELGVASEDLCLVARARRAPAKEARIARRLVDSGQVQAEELRLGPGRVQREGVEGLESSVGAGIGTETFDDDVSGVEEMDDASDVAENLAEPVRGRWYGLDDLEDAERFADRGTLDSTRPPTPGFGQLPFRKPTGDRPYSTEVLGRVLILGDGPLATAMLAAGLRRPTPDPVGALHASLHQLGVAASEAVELAKLFEEGGAVLAITETPGRVLLTEVEAVLEELGGRNLRRFVQRA